MSQSTASLQIEHPDTPATAPAWRTELNAKLEAHRRRRGPTEAAVEPVPLSRQPVRGQETGAAGRAMAARVAARVAERYAHAPSYSEVLAVRAAAASAAAGAAATAAQEAHAAAQELLSSLAAPQWATAESGSGVWPSDAAGGLAETPETLKSPATAERARWAAATVEHPEPLPARAVLPPRISAGAPAAPSLVDAFAEAEVPAAMSLPAKLIEFPRELVASQRARPRIAEGPLVEQEEAGLLPLRIFEVHHESGLAAPGRDAEDAESALTRSALNGSWDEGQECLDDGLGEVRTGQHSPGKHASYAEGHAASGREEAAPGWQSIRLGEHPQSVEDEPALQHRAHADEACVLLLAPLADRAMAALVDLGLVAGGFLLFVRTFAACTTHPPTGRLAMACGAAVFAALAVFYQWLFLSYGAGTPGMRYARVALCTFDDNNPTRAMLRSRVWAGLLAALPLGLGLLWALVDEDSLGWHDRLTATYQRSY